MQRADSSEKWKRHLCPERLRAGGEGASEAEMVGWRDQLDGHGLEKPNEIVEDRGAWHATVHEGTESRTRLSD